jgi:hypothetical protein
MLAMRSRAFHPELSIGGNSYPLLAKDLQRQGRPDAKLEVDLNRGKLDSLVIEQF